MANFKIQVPTSIIRDKTLTCLHFVSYLKLIQLYYLSGQKELLNIDHKKLMQNLNISENRVIRAALNEIYNRGFTFTEIPKLTRNQPLSIHINTKVLPEHNAENRFTQLPYQLLHKDILKLIGYIGVRLIYYYSSYINRDDMKRQYCFTALETISRETGISEKTIIKYNRLLQKYKFIKVEAHKLSTDNSYTTVGDKEILLFTKYNNHYYVNENKILEYYDKKFKAQN